MMFSKIAKLEALLDKLSAALETPCTKRYTANQAFRAENLHLAQGATLNIQMNNTVFSADIVNQCRDIVNDLKPFFPARGADLDQILNHYQNMLVQKALAESGYRKTEAAEKLGISFRRIRYLIQKNPEVMENNLILSEGGNHG